MRIKEKDQKLIGNVLAIGNAMGKLRFEVGERLDATCFADGIVNTPVVFPSFVLKGG